LGFISTGNKYASSLVDKLPGRGQTHAADRLGDDGDLPFQSLHFSSSFAEWLPCHRSPSRTVVRSGPHGAQPSSFRACTPRVRAWVARGTGVPFVTWTLVVWLEGKKTIMLLPTVA